MGQSALDHIELTYHDVMVFAIPEFKSLEVLKNSFMIILLYINPNTSHNQILILSIKKKLTLILWAAVHDENKLEIKYMIIDHLYDYL